MAVKALDNDSVGHPANLLLARDPMCSRWATEPHRRTKALPGANDDVGTDLARRLCRHNGEWIGSYHQVSTIVAKRLLQH